MKSERLKKLENELADLEQWLKLGLVPKKDIEKHKVEMESLKSRISEEQDRLQVLKENGDGEEFSLPKRNPAQRVAYQETATISGMHTEDDSSFTDEGLDLETESFDAETSSGDDDEEERDSALEEEEEEEDPFSDRNRWRRGVLEDPDADNW